MRRLHELHLQYPWMGSRGLRHQLGRAGFAIGRDQVRRLMRKMGREAVYRRPRTTIPAPGHKPYPYRLRTSSSSGRTGVDGRRDLHPDGAGLSLSGRHHGLVQPQGARLAAVEHAEG